MVKLSSYIRVRVSCSTLALVAAVSLRPAPDSGRQEPAADRLQGAEYSGQAIYVQRDRFRMLTQSNEERAEELLTLSREDAKARWNFYSQMAAMHYGNAAEPKK